MTVGAFDDVMPSPEAQRLLVSHKDGTAAVYSAETFKRQIILTSHEAIPLNANWSPSGKLIRTHNQGASLTIWDGVTGTPRRTWSKLVYSASAIDPSDHFLATATDTGEISIWDIESGTLLKVFQDRIGWKEPTAVYISDGCLRFTPDGRFLIFAGNSNDAKVWDWQSTHPLRLSLSAHTNSVCFAMFSPDSKTLLTASKDGAVIVWDGVTGRRQMTLRDLAEKPESEIPTALFIPPDGKRILAGSMWGEAKVWNPANGSLLKTMQFNKAALVLADTIRVAVNPSGKTCVTLSSNGRGALWNLSTLQQVGTFNVGARIGSGEVCFSRHGSKFIVAGSDGLARIFDSAKAELQTTLGSSGKSLVAAEIEDRGGKALTANEEGNITVWDIVTAKAIMLLNKDGPRVNEVHFSPDGASVAAATADTRVYVWNLKSGAEEFRLEEEKVGGEQFDVPPPIDLTPGATVRSGFLCVKFSPDGNFIAGANEYGRVCVWDARTDKQLLKLTGHIGRVISINFSADGSRIASCGEDSSAYVWRTSSAFKARR
jgi:WD40 repeat protein